MTEEMQEEFSVSKIEKYFFIKTSGDYPLMIAHSIKKPNREAAYQVQITKNCIPKLKKFINSKYGDPGFGRRAAFSPYYIDECKDVDTIYQFQRVLYEISEETEMITIYWIGEAISHVDIDTIAIPALIKFINENF